MTREEKVKVVGNLREKIIDNNFFYITDAAGLSVDQINVFRKICFEKGIEYHVYKNTLIKKALEKLDTDYTDFDDKVLKGFSGIIFSKKAGNIPAKAIKEFRKLGKTGDKLILKGASIDTELFIGEENLTMLSELKSKNELIGEIISLLQSPTKNIIAALQSSKSTIAGLIKTLSDREN